MNTITQEQFAEIVIYLKDHSAEFCEAEPLSDKEWATYFQERNYTVSAKRMRAALDLAGIPWLKPLNKYHTVRTDSYQGQYIQSLERRMSKLQEAQDRMADELEHLRSCMNTDADMGVIADVIAAMKDRLSAAETAIAKLTPVLPAFQKNEVEY